MHIKIERSNPHRGRINLVRLKSRGRTIHVVPAQVVAGPAIAPDIPQCDPPTARAAEEDGTPAVRAWRARRRLKQRLKAAERGAKGQARLRRADEYELLRCAYAAVRCWQRDGIAEEIQRELRAEAQVAISRASSLFLVLLRSALPHLDAKRASKWAAALEFAAHHDIGSKRLSAFLREYGGIEGAARRRAKLRANAAIGAFTTAVVRDRVGAR